MDKYKLTFGVEPTDKYNKAKQDLIQALSSLQELSPQEQKVLAEEMFGIAQVAVAMDMFNKYLGRWNNVQFIKDILEIIYYIAFIVLTWLIVKYSIKTYKLQTSKTSNLLCKISLSPGKNDKDFSQYYLEIYNFGNEVAKEIEVMVENTLITTIGFVKPNESFYYPIGTVRQMISCNRVYLLDDEHEIEKDQNITVKLKTKDHTSNYTLNTDILFTSRRDWGSDYERIADAIDDLSRYVQMSRR